MADLVVQVPREAMALLLAEAAPARGARVRVAGGHAERADKGQPAERGDLRAGRRADEVRQRALEVRGQRRHRARLRDAAQRQPLAGLFQRERVRLEARLSERDRVRIEAQHGERIELVGGDAERVEPRAPAALDLGGVRGERAERVRQRRAGVAEQRGPTARGGGSLGPRHVRSRGQYTSRVSGVAAARQRIVRCRRDLAGRVAGITPRAGRSGNRPGHANGGEGYASAHTRHARALNGQSAPASPPRLAARARSPRRTPTA
jgi:hypothetical protein